ncbi:MAG TPA: UvrD-helicase domain-containing protein, partial [Tenuifilaceae bacterium]|nr:UvrD-helicase domain-containing protein [Tenuifilaceae bacterium]
MQDYLNELSEVQRQAVTTTEGPSLVIASAGSGKTRVLTFRIAHLLTQGVPPWSILALTFTNKAAKEMKERIGRIVGEKEASKLWMGTFHSIFAKILRNEAEKLGFVKTFTIYDTTDSKNLINQIIKELKLDPQVYKASEVLSRISSAKNNLVTPQAYSSNSNILAQDAKSRKSEINKIYTLYAQRCYKASAMDFDDLLLNVNILFRDFPDVLEHYQRRFRYILVDEYQDTNLSQYMIVKKLATNHRNVCVVGDDAQSIYSFRGAKIENILNFRNDYQDYKLFKLEQNYRSTQTIVNAANSVIEKNQKQIKKVAYSANDVGEKVKLLQSYTDQEEGFLVASEIINIVQQNHCKYSDIAILYRTNAQSRIFEETLRKRNIPYKVYGSLSFYQRKEIKDLLAYFRLAVNPNDDEALLRIVNYPARRIGDTTLQHLTELANHN